MIDVYICEDHPEQRKVISQYIRSAILIEEYDMKIGMETEDPEKILEAVRNSENMGLYFLDIELNTNMNGLVLADRIREYDPRGFIVFITSHSEMSFLTFQYKVEALDFILKDHPQQMQRQICECMKHVGKRFQLPEADEELRWNIRRLFFLRRHQMNINLSYIQKIKVLSFSER